MAIGSYDKTCLGCLVSSSKQLAICHFIINTVVSENLNWIFFMGIFIIQEILLPTPNKKEKKKFGFR